MRPIVTVTVLTMASSIIIIEDLLPGHFVSNGFDVSSYRAVLLKLRSGTLQG